MDTLVLREFAVTSDGGENMLLRQPKFSDAESYPEYLKRNWERFRGSMPVSNENTFSVPYHQERFSRSVTNPESATAVMFVIVAEGEPNKVMGDITFSNITHGPFKACFLGYKIDERIEGQGVMRRALEISCALVFEQFDLHRIMANYRPENERSANILKRLNFSVEGFARDYLLLDGAWRDHVLTSLIREV